MSDLLRSALLSLPGGRLHASDAAWAAGGPFPQGLTSRIEQEYRYDLETIGWDTDLLVRASDATAHAVLVDLADGRVIIKVHPNDDVVLTRMRTIPGIAWSGTHSHFYGHVNPRTARCLRVALTGRATTISTDAGPALAAAANAPIPTEMSVDGEHIAVTTPNWPALKDDLQRTPGVRWDGTRWIVDATPANAKAFLAVARTHDLVVDESLDALAAEAGRPFDYDLTIQGLVGVPTSDVHTVAAQPARGKTASLEDRLAKMDLRSVWDLLMHIPLRYIDRNNKISLSALAAHVGEEISLIARVIEVGAYNQSNKMTRVKIGDGSGFLDVTFFRSPWIGKRFKRGDEVLVHGKVSIYQPKTGSAKFQMTNPMMDPLGEDTANMVPVYPQSATTAKVTTWEVHRAVMESVGRLGDLTDPIPEHIIGEHNLIGRKAAFIRIHRPDTMADVAAARHRLAFDELLRMQLVLGIQRNRRASEIGVVHAPTGELSNQLIAALPYNLTGAQQRAIKEITDDLCSPHPMHRMLQGDVGAGKAQPLSAGVLTPAGYRPMGDLTVGDEVINPTGHITTVTGVYPQGVRKVYRVHLSDGTSVRADGEHLWSVRTSVMRHKDRPPKTMTTLEILADLTEANGAHKWHVDMCEPVDLEGGEDRPIDPYLLGVILGDGSVSNHTTPTITSGDPQLLEILRESAPPGMEFRTTLKNERCETIRCVNARLRTLDRALDPADVDTMVRLYSEGYSLTTLAKAAGFAAADPIKRRLTEAGVALRPSYRTSPLVEGLRSLNLLGHTAVSKFIPSAYLNAPVKDRHAMLQGLLDTDGTLDYRTGYNVTFSTISTQLADDVAWLVRSIGGLARVTEKVRSSGESLHVRITLPEEYPPFRLDRKAMWVHKRTKYAYPARAITAIEPDGEEPVQCIRVAHPNHLYVTDNFTRTHNTTVASLSILAAVEGGFQAALMAPTEILATQLHAEMAETFARLHHPETGTPLVVEFLGGKTTAKNKRRVHAGLADGTVHVVVGTHALLVDDVTFSNLGFVVIDEQHRFGVEQRAALRAKGVGGSPDVLAMTATPIPRTASLTVFGDLEQSILDELPPGRTPIRTSWIPSEAPIHDPTAAVWEKIKNQVSQGRQAYVVASLVEDNEKIAAASAEETFEALQHGPLASLRLGLVHGQMARDEREATMAAFKDGNIDVLVSTTVIEVGVNVPNATVMVVLDAPRFGIAQLHQIRGRVGRGRFASECVLIGEAKSDDGRERMEALVESTDGFYLSDVDLRLRGGGALFGTRQSGQSDLRVAKLPDDIEMVYHCRRYATDLLKSDPDLRRRPGLRHEVFAALGEDAGDALTRI